MRLLSRTAVLVPKFSRSENVAIIADFSRDQVHIYYNWNFFNLHFYKIQELQNSRSAQQ